MEYIFKASREYIRRLCFSKLYFLKIQHSLHSAHAYGSNSNGICYQRLVSNVDREAKVPRTTAVSVDRVHNPKGIFQSKIGIVVQFSREWGSLENGGMVEAASLQRGCTIEIEI